MGLSMDWGIDNFSLFAEMMSEENDTVSVAISSTALMNSMN